MDQQRDFRTGHNYRGIDPGEIVAPVTCPRCGASVETGREPALTQTANEMVFICQACGARVDRHERLLDEYGPEVFVPGALLKRDLSGLAIVLNGLCLIAVAFVVLLVVRHFIGGWGWPALIATATIWGLYALIRRRRLRDVVREIARQFRLDEEQI